jgi:hypothetical protein
MFRFKMYTSLFSSLSPRASCFAFARKFSKLQGATKQTKHSLTISRPRGFFQTTQSQSGAMFG